MWGKCFTEIKVEDNGKGIEPAHINDIFKEILQRKKRVRDRGAGIRAVPGKKDHNAAERIYLRAFRRGKGQPLFAPVSPTGFRQEIVSVLILFASGLRQD